MKLAVILFAYKRHRTLKKVLQTITKVDADYYCFIDHSEQQQETIEIVAQSAIFDSIAFRSKPFGLNANITMGISEIFDKGYDAVIVLEDDILISKGGLEWLNEQLIIYKHTENIGAISLCKGKFMDSFKCWGWGTWKEKWDAVNWRLDVSGKFKKGWDKTHSWDYYLAFWMDLNGLFTRCHSKGLSKHIGYIGTHFNWMAGLKNIYQNWKDDYYRDKDLIMIKERFPKNLFRFIKNL